MVIRFRRLPPVQFIELTRLVAFAQACLAFAQAVQGRRFLPASDRGCPKVYSDLCFFLTPIIQQVWQKSNLTAHQAHITASKNKERRIQ
jgi:hypothetical protein